MPATHAPGANLEPCQGSASAIWFALKGGQMESWNFILADLRKSVAARSASGAVSKAETWGSAPGIQIAMQLSAESAIQLALIQLVCRK